MIDCKDFVPREIRGPGFQAAFTLAAQGEYETFQAALVAANQWIDGDEVDVLNLETVVLPNIWEEREEGPRDPSLRTGSVPQWHQFIRVWYRTRS